ncbi:hypothetical protein Hamer_G000330 [Homarus americanus]|uniref:Uncharacterized protein n=1 Tax=Homarus americanus TaxID=6706 RepID=A0A8J5ND69_HOMAM|nr:hypothetical protein Hamer_G000330 [Homarus americanus]
MISNYKCIVDYKNMVSHTKKKKKISTCQTLSIHLCYCMLMYILYLAFLSPNYFIFVLLELQPPPIYFTCFFK